MPLGIDVMAAPFNPQKYKLMLRSMMFKISDIEPIYMLYLIFPIPKIAPLGKTDKTLKLHPIAKNGK